MNETLDNIKNKAKRAAIKAGEFFTQPSVRRVSRFSAGILELLACVDRKNPVSIGSGTLSLIDMTLDAFEFPYSTKVEHFVKKRGLEAKSGSLPRMLIDSGIVKDFPYKSAFVDGTWTFKELNIDKDSKLYFAENTDNSTFYQDPLSRYSVAYYHSNSFNFEKLFDFIWKKYPNGVYLAASSKSAIHNGGIRFCPLVTDDCLYIGDLNPKKFGEDIKLFQKDEMSRSFMLAGEPGTGKTSFVI